MKYRLILIFLTITCLTLSSCASKSSSLPDYGPVPLDYRAMVKQYTLTHLKDPYSVRDLNISPLVRVRKLWVGLLNGGYWDGFACCVSYNAKNSFGAYTGIQYRVFLLKNGEIVRSAKGCPAEALKEAETRAEAEANAPVSVTPRGLNTRE